MAKPLVLVFEDSPEVLKSLQRHLRDHVELLTASTVENARNLFKTHPYPAAIGIDACLEGNKPDTLELITEIRSKYSGPMIAISSMLEYRELQVEAGCDYQCEKYNFINRLLHLLRL